MRKRVVVKTVSPVHIGGKTQELTPLEAVINQGYCYVVDESRLGRALLEEGMMDRLYGEIDRKGRNFRLERFLQKVKLLNKEFLEKSAAYSSATRLRSTPNRLRPFVRDAWDCPFIPGSSIKGVLRTAVMYGVLKRMKKEKPEDFQRCLINEVEKKLREFNNAEQWKQGKPWFKDKIKRNMAGAVEAKLIQSFQLPLLERTVCPIIQWKI